MTSPTISRGKCISKVILHVHFFLRATTSKTLKGDTHISDVKISHVTNLKLVMAIYRKRHQCHNSNIYLILIHILVTDTDYTRH